MGHDSLNFLRELPAEFWVTTSNPECQFTLAMPPWNVAHKQYERAVAEKYKSEWLGEHRHLVYFLMLFPWFTVVRILWWTVKYEVPFSISVLVLGSVILATEFFNWRQGSNAQWQIKEIRRRGAAVRPRRRMRQSLRGALPRPQDLNAACGFGHRRPDEGVHDDDQLNQPQSPEGSLDGMRAPRPARSKLLDPLTTPGKSDIEELTRGFRVPGRGVDRDDDSSDRYRVLSEHDAEMFKGVRFKWEQKRYQASKPPRAPGFNQLRPEDLTPTSPTDLADFLQWMDLNYDILQVWSHRFRQWTAHNIIKKLDCEMSSAYEYILAISQTMGEQDIKLFPLSEVISLAEEKQEESWIRAKRESLQRELHQNPNDRADLKKSYLQAIENWGLLSDLLSCSWANGILPNTPRGYVGMRLKSMAVGTYMKGFQWNRPQQGEASFFPEELPSDSEIVIVMLAAYLATPGWNWQLMKERPPDSSGGPLYFGELPKYPEQKFSAILCKPPRTASTDAKAIIVRTRSAAWNLDPVFTLLVGGQLAVNLSSDVGIFQAMVLFLHYHRMHHDGRIGGWSLEVMDDVENIFEDVTAAKVWRLFGTRDRYHY